MNRGNFAEKISCWWIMHNLLMVYYAYLSYEILYFFVVIVCLIFQQYERFQGKFKVIYINEDMFNNSNIHIENYQIIWITSYSWNIISKSNLPFRFLLKLYFSLKYMLSVLQSFNVGKKHFMSKFVHATWIP